MLKITRWAMLAAVLLSVAVVAPHAVHAQGQAPAPAASSAAPAAAPAAPADAASAPAAAPAAKAARVTEVVDNPYGLEALWKGGDLVARITLGILVFMSMGSWYVIFVKIYEQAKLNRQGRKANQAFWNAPTVRDGINDLAEGSAYRFIAESGIE